MYALTELQTSRLDLVQLADLLEVVAVTAKKCSRQHCYRRELRLEGAVSHVRYDLTLHCSQLFDNRTVNH